MKERAVEREATACFHMNGTQFPGPRGQTDACAVVAKVTRRTHALPQQGRRRPGQTQLRKRRALKSHLLSRRVTQVLRKCCQKQQACSGKPCEPRPPIRKVSRNLPHTVPEPLSPPPSLCQPLHVPQRIHQLWLRQPRSKPSCRNLEARVFRGCQDSRCWHSSRKRRARAYRPAGFRSDAHCAGSHGSGDQRSSSVHGFRWRETSGSCGSKPREGL